MNEDAADALLKDLEEPPDYAVIVLVADDLGPIPETIRSRCQLVPFTRLSERAIRERGRRPCARARRGSAEPRWRASRAGGSTGSRGCSTRRRRARRETLLEQARAVYSEPAFEPADAASALLESARERGARGA